MVQQVDAVALRTDIRGDSTNLVRATRDANRALRRHQEIARRVRRNHARSAGAADRYNRALGGLSRQLAGGAVLFGLQSAIRRSVSFGASLVETAQSVGATVEELQALDRVARSEGVQFNLLSRAFFRFNRVLGEAANGVAEYQRILADLGLDWQSLINLPLPQRLAVIAERLRLLNTETERSNAVQNLFGRGGARVTPILESAASLDARFRRVEQLNKLSEEQALQLKDLAQEWQNFTDVSGTALRQLVAEGSPALSELLEEVSSGLTQIAQYVSAIREVQQLVNNLRGVRTVPDPPQPDELQEAAYARFLRTEQQIEAIGQRQRDLSRDRGDFLRQAADAAEDNSEAQQAILRIRERIRALQASAPAGTVLFGDQRRELEELQERQRGLIRSADELAAIEGDNRSEARRILGQIVVLDQRRKVLLLDISKIGQDLNNSTIRAIDVEQAKRDAAAAAQRQIDRAREAARLKEAAIVEGILTAERTVAQQAERQVQAQRLSGVEAERARFLYQAQSQLINRQATLTRQLAAAENEGNRRKADDLRQQLTITSRNIDGIRQLADGLETVFERTANARIELAALRRETQTRLARLDVAIEGDTARADVRRTVQGLEDELRLFTLTGAAREREQFIIRETARIEEAQLANAANLRKALAQTALARSNQEREQARDAVAQAEAVSEALAEQHADITRNAEAFSDLFDRTAEARRARQRMEDLREGVREVTRELEDIAVQAIGAVRSMDFTEPREALKDLVDRARDLVFELLLIRPLARSITSGGTSFLGDLLGGGLFGSSADTPPPPDGVVGQQANPVAEASRNVNRVLGATTARAQRRRQATIDQTVQVQAVGSDEATIRRVIAESTPGIARATISALEEAGRI